MKHNIKVGDIIYVSRFGQKEVTLDCPVCFGKKKVDLILGNGDSIELPCDYCRRGYEYPSGFIKRISMEANAEQMLVTAVKSTQTEKGEKFEYSCGYFTYQAEDVFLVKSEALKDSVHKAEKHKIETETRAEYVKAQSNKSYSWNAGFHMRAVKDAKKNIEYHSKMALICKTKSKTEGK